MGPSDHEQARRVIAQWLNEEVLEAFDTLFPERSADVRDSIDEIRHSGGQRSVIRFLRGLAGGDFA